MSVLEIVLVLVFIVVITGQNSVSPTAALAPEHSLAMAVAAFGSAVGGGGFAVVGAKTLRDGDLSHPVGNSSSTGQ